MFERFATFLQFAGHKSVTAGELEHYLDDFIFGGKANTNHCAVIMANFQSCCQRLGVPIAEEKTEGPATVIVFLGLELDSELMEVPIQIEKVQKLLSQIHKTLEQKSIKLQDLQSLIGSLNFMCRAIAPGRAFLRRLINATCGVTKPFYHVHINSGMQHDLHTWLDFFQTFNGVSCFNDRFWCSNADVSLYTDSTAGFGNGFGAYFQGSWCQGWWPDEWFTSGITKDITVLELFPILVCVHIWGHQLAHKKILF